MSQTAAVDSGGHLYPVNGSHHAAELESVHSGHGSQNSDNEEEDESSKETFRKFTKQSYIKLIERENEQKRKEANNGEDEGRLVDGEIVFDDDGETAPEKDPKLAEGQCLPENMGRFPRDLLSIPLEEIDPNIKDKVRLKHISNKPINTRV